ncbi:MAG: hypothetical protein KGI54_17575 [Pseudomonadota bacterium]|nr:hypothetical protein [Pseudomonadota bacterium]
MELFTIFTLIDYSYPFYYSDNTILRKGNNMGYPMTYDRVVSRNSLQGDYDNPDNNIPESLIRGDLRRFETDMRDDYHLSLFAHYAEITKEQAKLVLDLLFDKNGYIMVQALNKLMEDK